MLDLLKDHNASRRVFRLLVLVIDIAVLIFSAVALISSIKHSRSSDIFTAALVTTISLLNILAIAHSPFEATNFIALRLKRKCIEETQLIEGLKK